MQPNPDIAREHLDLALGGTSKDSPEQFLADFDLARVPTAPGCYLMLDPKGKPIYIGKAKSLRARLRSYINATDSRYSVKFLMRRVARIEFLVTASEKEAILLENSLIKQYRPRYNVQLKDDKTFISLRIDPRHEFPRLTLVRRWKNDGARYFGPYHEARSVRLILKQVQRLFPLRTCSDHVLHNRTRPCLYYQMKQCAGPCVGLIDAAGYAAIVEQVILFLEGRSGEVEQCFKERIQRLADQLEFEQAAALRDRLYELRRMMERQRAVHVPGAEDRDVFGLYGEGRYTEVQVLFYRGGRMTGGRTFSFERSEMPRDELLASLLLQYYSESPVLPQEVLVPLPVEDAEALSEVLSEQRGARVRIHCPARGEKAALVALADRNARRSFESKRLAEKANADTLEQLKAALHLAKLPERIECFDISNLQGTRMVASKVCFTQGMPDKARYRRYSIRQVEGQDDFAAMREVLLRRFSRGLEEDDLPDLVLIDGGKGQLNVATAALQDLGIEDLPHAAIAKSRLQEGGGRSPERIFLPGRANPVVLPQNGPVVHLLARIRDEAHRFAISYHRARRRRETVATALTDIPGVGPRRARALLNALGSIARIRTARVEEIAAVQGFSPGLAETVRRHLDAESA